MPGELCYWIINMSIIASVMGLLVMLIRKIRFIPHRVSVVLWVIPFIRMCIPFGLSSKFSLMSLISRFTTRTITLYQPVDELKISTMNSIMMADSYDPFTYKTQLLEKIFNVAGLESSTNSEFKCPNG